MTFKPGAFGLLAEAEPLRRATATFLDAAVLQIEGMGVALAAVADDGDFLALDQIDVGVPIVINAHLLCFPRLAAGRPIWRLSDARPGNGLWGVFMTPVPRDGLWS